MTPEQAFRVLQVDPAACRPVIDAAFGVLREMCLREDADDAPARLAELTRAHRIATGEAEQGPSGANGDNLR